MSRAKVEVIPSTETSFQECSICLKPIKKLLKRTACNHCYHPKCLNNWIKYNANCPLCRKEIYTRKRPPVRRNLEQEFENVIERLQRHIDNASEVTILNDAIYVEDSETILFAFID